ncbi:MAG: hypoxanthine-guanine phosphoribosyltransferase [Halomonadaceae bacterium]|nr:MAG: hypoxanthine-guanine phosphoribosyltransferase [Halomonadaceae bacterium]
MADPRAASGDPRQILADADCLYTQTEVEAALTEMAQAITARLANQAPIILTVMNGGLIISGQLLTKLPFPLQQDYLHAGRYGHQTQGGELHWLATPGLSMQDRAVLILDDILDEGTTLLAIKEYCRQQGATQVLTAVLVDKQHNRKATPGLTADFTGLTAPDRFLFGYGMDYQGYLRNAPGIYAVKGL